MEERVKSADDDTVNLNDNPLPPLKPPPGHPSETYVVQIPKDQIYRIPPPENARIAEHYRSTPAGKKSSCRSRCLFVFLFFFILVFVLGIATGLFYLYLSPKTPEFSIAHVVVKNPKLTHKKHSHSYPTYEISLKAKNPNERMGIAYEGGGGAALSFKRKKIAAGKFPALSQKDGSSTTVKVVLSGSKAALPHEIERSLEGKKSNATVSLALTINVPVQMKFGIIKSRSMHMVVACNFMTNTLAKGTRVLSQKCHTKV